MNFYVCPKHIGPISRIGPIRLTAATIERSNMKKLFFLFLFSALIFAATLSHAQTRVAFIDATKILKRMPEAVDAETRLDQMVAGWNKEISDLESELKRKRDDF